jgi:hypothetical protein
MLKILFVDDLIIKSQWVIATKEEAQPRPMFNDKL